MGVISYFPLNLASDETRRRSPCFPRLSSSSVTSASRGFCSGNSQVNSSSVICSPPFHFLLSSRCPRKYLLPVPISRVLPVVCASSPSGAYSLMWTSTRGTLTIPPHPPLNFRFTSVGFTSHVARSVQPPLPLVNHSPCSDLSRFLPKLRLRSSSPISTSTRSGVCLSKTNERSAGPFA